MAGTGEWQRRTRAVYTFGMKLRRWAARLAAFYFGYKILHRQVYEVEEANEILIALGLWLCGVAPADIFDGLRKLGDKVTGEGGSIATPTPKPESGSSGSGDTG